MSTLTKQEKSLRMAAACRTVAADIESGKTVPGRFKTFEEKAPCCAIGHVLHAFGVMDTDNESAADEMGSALGLSGLECETAIDFQRAIRRVVSVNDRLHPRGRRIGIAQELENLAETVETMHVVEDDS